MATKNLARTVIEGGRRGYMKAERKMHNRRARRANRTALHVLTANWESAEEEIPVLRKRCELDQKDKLNPAWRWLEAHCGAPWREVKGLISKTFDMAGGHIIHDHLLREVADVGDRFREFSVFVVQDDGILVHRQPRKRTWQKRLSEYKDIREWLAGRYIGRRGNKLYWFVQAKKKKSRFELVDIFFPMHPRYRQDRRLTLVEENIFFAMSQKARRELLDEGSRNISNLVL